MDVEIPELGDYYEDEYEKYEKQYADNIDMVDEFEETYIDFESNTIRKSNRDLDNNLLQDVLKEKMQKCKQNIEDHSSLNGLPPQSFSKKRSYSLSNLSEDEDDFLKYSDDEIDHDSEMRAKKLKSNFDDKQAKNNSKERITNLLNGLTSDYDAFDAIKTNFSQKHVFSRPVLGQDMINITSTEGERVFMKLHPREISTNDQMASWQANANMDGLNLLSVPYQLLKANVEERRLARQLKKSQTIVENTTRNLNSSERQSYELWVEKYTPKKYTELLSDDGTNRVLLKWLKLWDDIVFSNKKKIKAKPKTIPNTESFSKKKSATPYQKYDFEEELVHDNQGRPKRKIALLCGNPGLGKTTLAHVISKHAGYNVVEMNASDDRSPELFLNRIEATTQMKAMLGMSNKPNCLVIDEIDGAPIQAINILLEMIKHTENAGGKTKKKRKKKELVLNRPIICICNDPFVPALRQLRGVAFTLHFPPTLGSRLAGRLLSVSQNEGLRIDMGALLLLVEKTENDIRSCLNTLQFINERAKDFKMEDVKTIEVGQKDMRRGVRTVLGEIFQLPRSKRKLYETQTESNPKTGSAARFYYILHLVSGNTDFDKIMQGLFDHYLNLKTKDPYLESIINACDWLEFSDIMEHKIQSNQNYTLRKYLSFLPVAFHMYFARASNPKLQYSNISYENHLKTTHNLQTLQLMKAGMQPQFRRHCLRRMALLEFVPYLFLLTLPNLRPINMRLYSESEKQMFISLIEVMIAYNLTYRQERNFEGQYTYMLEPNIEELTTFTGLPQHRHLPYATKQLIAREIDMEKMRMAERVTKPAAEQNYAAVPQSTNHVTSQKLVFKKVHTQRKHFDFFGRIVQNEQVKGISSDNLKTRNEDTSKNSLLNKKIWFRFNEGYTNAVRKTVKINAFL